MSDGQFLALLFTAFYLLDCLRWNPPHSRVFARWWGRRWRLQKDGSGVVLRGLSPTFLNPLPNLGDHLSPDDWPAIPTAEGLHRINHEGRVLARIPWGEIQIKRERGAKKISLGKRYRSLRFASETSAALWESVLRSYQAGNAPSAATVFGEAYFSASKARRAVERLKIATASLRAWCVQVWLICALALPLMILLLGTHIVTFLGFAFLLLATLCVSICYFRICGRFAPELRSTRGTNAFVLALVPFHAIRACDLLGSEAAGQFHPIAVAAATLEDEPFQRFASATWRSWNYGMSPRPQFLIDGIEKVCAARGLSLSVLNAPPMRDGTSTSYCPRCHATFEKLLALCPDCTEVQPELFKD